MDRRRRRERDAAPDDSVVHGHRVVDRRLLFHMTNLGVLPHAGTAMGLGGWRFGVAVGMNFILGALMSVESATTRRAWRCSPCSDHDAATVLIAAEIRPVRTASPS
jgi:hypothetical protein